MPSITSAPSGPSPALELSPARISAQGLTGDHALFSQALPSVFNGSLDSVGLRLDLMISINSFPA